jgi:glycosyltransferase involved in cell wall biosynthesis
LRIPVIAAPKGGPAEIIIGGVTGFLVDTQSPAKLTNRPDGFFAGLRLRRRMRAAARECATSHFSRKRVIDDCWRLQSFSASHLRLERPV